MKLSQVGAIKYGMALLIFPPEDKRARTEDRGRHMYTPPMLSLERTNTSGGEKIFQGDWRVGIIMYPELRNRGRKSGTTEISPYSIIEPGMFLSK